MELKLPEKFSEFNEARQNGFLKVKALKEEGKKVAGVFCTFTPLEILDAAGFVSVSLCGMSEETIEAAEVDLPKNLCPLIKSSYGFYVSDKCPYTYFSDLIVGETTCDGKKKMYELMGRGKKTFILHLPQGEADFAVEEWTKELRRFIEFIEKEYNVKITDEALRNAAKKRNEERTERALLMGVQKQVPPLAKGIDLYKTMDNVGFLFDEDERINKLKDLRLTIEKENNQEQNKNKKRILVTGCPIGGVLQKTVGAIEENGGVVVCFENCAGLKACLKNVDTEKDDIVRAIAERYLSIGCAVMAPNNTRMNNLKELVKEYKIDGVVDIILHACTTYEVETKIVSDLMKEINMPFLSLQTDYTKGDEGQLLTRIQAFMEMMN